MEVLEDLEIEVLEISSLGDFLTWRFPHLEISSLGDSPLGDSFLPEDKEYQLIYTKGDKCKRQPK
jgi:hypothetical protein